MNPDDGDRHLNSHDGRQNPAVDSSHPAAIPAPPPDAAAAPAGRSRTRSVLLLSIGGVLVISLAVAGIVPRMHADHELAQQTREKAIATVTVMVPKLGAPQQEIVLPGNIQAFSDAPIYARTNGYLKKWYADIGARVKKGQLLAEIETPEADQQLDQARADLATAQANLELSQITAKRYLELIKTNSVSQQDTDNAVADAKAKATMVNSSQANVRRLAQLQSFEKIYAPFDGVITARDTDVGQLIDSGSATGTAHELFHMAAINTLRVYVNVPQIDSRSALPGMTAYLTLAEIPGKHFDGKLVRNSNSISAASRTLLAEVDVNNTTGELLPGAYTQVHLSLPRDFPTLLVPVSALIFQSEGLRVATLGADSRAHMTPITVGRDYGTQVEVVAGLTPGQQVVDNPPDSLVEGQELRVAQNRAASRPRAL